MKKTILTSLALTCAVGAFAQGTVIFNNRITGALVTHVWGGGSSQIRGNGSSDLPSGSQTYPGNLLIGTTGGFAAATTWTSLLGGPIGTAESNLVAGALGPSGVGGGTAATFRTGAGAGFIGAYTATFNGITANASSALFEMVAWDNSSGNYPTWAAASAAWQLGLIAAGSSGVFTVQAIGGTQPAPQLDGLQSFNIFQTIPEPTTIALAGLGAAALVIFRRRKQ